MGFMQSKCKALLCDQKPINRQSNYCIEHCCKYPQCYRNPYYHSDYCKLHKCKHMSCDDIFFRYPGNTYNYCKQHFIDELKLRNDLLSEIILNDLMPIKEREIKL